MSDDLDPTRPKSEQQTPSRLRLLGRHFLNLSHRPAALLERRASLNFGDEISLDATESLRESPIANRLQAGNFRSSIFIPEATSYKGNSRSRREADTARPGRITYGEENVYVTPADSSPTPTRHDGASCGPETTCSNATTHDRRSRPHNIKSSNAASVTAASVTAASVTAASDNEASSLYPKSDKMTRALDQETESSGDGVEVHIPSQMLDSRGSVLLKIRLARKSLSHPLSRLYALLCEILSIFCYATCVVLIMLVPITKVRFVGQGSGLYVWDRGCMSGVGFMCQGFRRVRCLGVNRKRRHTHMGRWRGVRNLVTMRNEGYRGFRRCDDRLAVSKK